MSDDTTNDLPHGTLLGTTKCGVSAYATNYNEFKLRNPPPYDFKNYENNIHTGLQYQCVEFARRYWIHHYQYLLRNVCIAAEIWDQKFVWVLPLESRKIVPLKSYNNGSDIPPMIGDLLIYDQHPEQRTGHVAVVVEVGDNFVRVAEQNRYNDKKWPEPSNYSFEIPMTIENGKYILTDDDSPALFGWIRLCVDDMVVRPPWKPAVINEDDIGHDGLPFWKAVQKFLETFPDGILGKFTVRCLQRFLNLYTPEADQLDANNDDGIVDVKTITVLQKFLNRHPKLSLLNNELINENGELNVETRKAFQRFMIHVGSCQDVEYAVQSMHDY